MHRLTLALALLTVACSGGTPSRVETEAPARDPGTASPTYALHEWGLISVRGAGFEVSAGPGQRVMEAMTADKPVLYVHTDDQFTLDLRVEPPAGLSVVEHYDIVRKLDR